MDRNYKPRTPLRGWSKIKQSGCNYDDSGTASLCSLGTSGSESSLTLAWASLVGLLPGVNIDIVVVSPYCDGDVISMFVVGAKSFLSRDLRRVMNVRPPSGVATTMTVSPPLCRRRPPKWEGEVPPVTATVRPSALE